jgi:hypothetical protein
VGIAAEDERSYLHMLQLLPRTVELRDDVLSGKYNRIHPGTLRVGDPVPDAPLMNPFMHIETNASLLSRSVESSVHQQLDVAAKEGKSLAVMISGSYS